MKQLSEQQQAELDRRYRLTLLVFASQIGTAIVLTAVAWFAAGDTNPQQATALTSVLWIVLLVIAVGAFLLRRVMLSPAVLRDTATLKGVVGVIKNLQFKTILFSALAEAIAVIGFVISLLSGDKYDMLRAAIVALIIFFISFPRKKGWETIAAAAAP